MLKRSIYLFGFVLFMLSACVPAKKLVYLQEGDELKQKKEVVYDSVLRVRQMQIEEYEIQPLDQLRVQFITITDNEFNFFRQVQGGGQGNNNNNNRGQNGIIVDTEGNIEFPVLGKVNVSGLTIFEAQEKLQNLAENYLKDVVVRVFPLNFRYTLLTESTEQVVISNNTRITMMEAIGEAGGVGELSDRSYVKVIRQKGDKAEVYYVNLLEEKFIESEFYFVKQNDIIIVPPLKQRTFRRYFTQNLGIIVGTVTSVLLLVNIFVN